MPRNPLPALTAMKPVLRLLLSASLVSVLAACSSPPIRYYSLGPLPAAEAGPLSANGASLVVGPVSVPAAVDRHYIVRMEGGTRAEVSDSHRWAAPLKSEIARRVAVDLARRTPYARAVAWPQASLAEPAYTLPIDVQRFAAETPERVTLEAVWSLRKNGREVVSRRFVATEAPADGSWEALASAHGRLVDALSTDIAAHLPPP